METNTIKPKKLIKFRGKEKLIINIRCDDECNNGHDTFAITADIYEKKDNGQYYWSGGGCCHDDILEVMPSLKQFVDLHLCDGNGIPSSPLENGFHFYLCSQNAYRVFDHCEREPKYNGKENFTYFCDHLRITHEEGQTLVSKLNDLYHIDRSNYVGDTIVKLKSEIYHIEEAIKHLKKSSEYSDVSELDKRQLEAVQTIATLKDELKEYKRAAKDYFANYVNSCVPRWNIESEQAKEVLQAIK